MSGTNDMREKRNSFWQRLQPFIRRDLRSRLISAFAAIAVCLGLGLLAVSAFTKMDSQGAHALRVEMGLETPYAVCGGPGQPACSYDDREQELVEKQFSKEQRLRAAILHELDLRIADSKARLEAANELLERQNIDFSNELPFGGNAELASLLATPDLRPLPPMWQPVDGLDSIAPTDLVYAGTYDGYEDVSPAMTQARLERAIGEQLERLSDYEKIVARQRDRLVDLPKLTSLVDRKALIAEVRSDAAYMDDADIQDAAAWLEMGLTSDASRAAGIAARRDYAEFASGLRPDSTLWQGGWDTPRWDRIHKPSVRYASPVPTMTRMRLLGTLMLLVGSFLLLVVGPVVTATATAREREAGTLPVLRMTGLSAGDLAAAMVFGPNVFAFVGGALALLLGGMLVAVSAGPSALVLPFGLLVFLAAATHLTAIGLGDALGQRVNAMVVGGLTGLAIVGPGLLGTALAAFDVTSTGLMLGPLPSVFAGMLGIAEFPQVALHVGAGSAELSETILVYGVFSQVLLGLVCLHSWRRRVESGWAPLFRPLEGVLLGLASIGCSALSLLDVSKRTHAQGFDELNLLTFLSCSFLLPMLGWLLVSSLRRPARARAVTSRNEALRAFARFQAFLLVTAGLVGAAYYVIVSNTGLLVGDSEVMWATLTQVLLVAETAVAGMLLWSRRPNQRVRLVVGGGLLVLLQTVLGMVVYGLEVEHVARTNTAAMPFLVNADVSTYWIAFLVVVWGAGLGLILTALLRARDKKQAEEEARAEEERDEEPDGMPGRRLIH